MICRNGLMLPPEEQQALLQKIGMDESDAPSGS